MQVLIKKETFIEVKRFIIKPSSFLTKVNLHRVFQISEMMSSTIFVNDASTIQED